MKLVLLLMVGTAYSVCFATAQSLNITTDDINDNVTDSPLVTCAPEPTCPQVEECSCPPVTECPTTESTRTRRPGRTDTGRTRTRTAGTNRTHTHSGRTRTRTDGKNGRTNRTHTHSGRTGPGRRSKTHKHHGRTRNDETGEYTNRTRTHGPGSRTHRTRPMRDCTPRLPPGCEEYVTTAAPVTFTSTADTTPPPRPSPNVCLSSVIDATGKREIPMIALQFRFSEKNPFAFASEASDFAEVISLLASESVGLDMVSAAVLGISALDNGLSVVVAVSFNVTANRDYTLSSSQIVETIYEHLDQLGEYYHVTDMKTVRMVAQNYSPSSASVKPKTTLSTSAVATIVLSILALIGILSIFVILTMKLRARLSQKSNENQPLLEDQVEERRSSRAL